MTKHAGTRRRFVAQSLGGALIAPAAAAEGELATRRLQASIDQAARAGGGTVVIQPGRYVTGTLYLKSHVTLHLAAGATIVGSPNLGDYPVTVARVRSYTDVYTDKSLFYGEDLENVRLEGAGTIDGSGKAFSGPYKVRPYTIRIVSSKRVTVTGLAIRDSPMWVQHYLACEDVNIRGITVESRVNNNNDGIDIDACDRVRISDCDVSSGDDAIVFKSTLLRPTRNVVVTNCVLSTRCNALKLGTESNGGFENIAVSNCVIRDTRLSGIAIECVDGGTLERVLFSGIVMDGVGAPIFIRLGDRGRPFETGGPRQPVGKLRRVMIRDVEAVRASAVGCAIAGLPGAPVEDITLDNVRLEFVGGGKPEYEYEKVPEKADQYPEHRMFGNLPAYGFYCRHARRLSFRNVQVSTATPDARPAMLTEDVAELAVSGPAL